VLIAGHGSSLLVKMMKLELVMLAASLSTDFS